MTRDQHLQYCKVCINRRFDAQQGILCNLTGKIADFESSCPNFYAEAGHVITADVAAHADPTVKPFLADAVRASNGKRFANLLIDYVVLIILNIVLGIMLGLFLAVFFPEDLDSLDNYPKIWDYLFSITIFLIYYITAESVTGRTVGKLITGTRVVDKHGKTPDTTTIIKRTFSRLVPFEAFSFLGSEPGWHDTWTDTHVVEK